MTSSSSSHDPQPAPAPAQAPMPQDQPHPAAVHHAQERLLAQPAEALKCELAAEVLRLAGELRLRVTGTSMLPALWPGDELTIRRDSAGAVRPGRIVLVARDGRLCVHRVVTAGNGLVTTRGDALPTADPPTAPDQVLGALVSIQRGSARLTPSFRVSLLALLLRHSDLCKSLLLRLRALWTWLSA